MLILGGLLDKVGIHEVHLITLIDEKLLVDANPLVILCLVIERYRVDMQLRILVTLEALLQPKDLHWLAHALLDIMNEMHMLQSTDHHEQDLVRLLYHYVAMIEVLHLLCSRHVINLVLRRLVVYRLVKIVHAEDGEGFLLVVAYVLLREEILVSEELVLILIVDLQQLVIVVEVLRENNIEGAVVIVVLDELVPVDHRLLVEHQVILE